MALTIPKILLLFLSIAGFWTLWVFPYENGLLKILGQQNQPGAVIPGPTAAPMKQTYTGIGPVDKQLTVLVSFFYTAIDGNRADVSLAFLYLGGQVLAAWVLITIESLRTGNQGKFILVAYASLVHCRHQALTNMELGRPCSVSGWPLWAMPALPRYGSRFTFGYPQQCIIRKTIS